MERISTSAFTLEQQGQSDRGVALALHGELDVTVATEAAALVERELANGHDIEIDLSGLEFVDSTGLVVLLRSREKAQALGRRLKITGPLQGQVRRVLRLSGLESLLLSDVVDPARATTEPAGATAEPAGVTSEPLRAAAEPPPATPEA